ncbi:hypothetical protein EXU30_04390 [Shewanella maritima]|uniref:DUF3137 domain-containing protein n=1 Tax=Shewanella maritima TaxID=2520507 RepID=A0A411PEQ1_9GAMM|nr:hypothetical protein [Shewanella maritima]QBF82021.1 hypothetical protein EXU30_04390 [Shewanella maritima]
MSTPSQPQRMDKPYNNKQLSQFLAKLKRQAAGSASIDTIKDCLDQAIALPYATKYRNQYHYISLLLGTIASIGLWLYLDRLGYSFSYYQQTHWLAFALLFSVIIGCVITLTIRHKRIKSTSKLLRDETIKHLYNMTECDGIFLAQAQSKFVDFQRGNHSRNIEWGKEIDFHTQAGVIRASVIHHHYVDQRQETYTETDSKGNTQTRTRTVYDHYHREGVIFPPINKCHSLVMSELRAKKHWPEKFMPASREFEKRFNVQTASEFEAAKFLEPVVVVACEALGKQLPQLTIEFAADGSLLINQNEANLLNPKMDHDITSPRAFKNELLNDTSLDTVNRIFGFVNKIIHHSVGPTR